jgi:3D (Asp-Asp-Asp) domain-containing protein
MGARRAPSAPLWVAGRGPSAIDVRRETARSLITLVAWSRLHLVEASQTLSAAQPQQQDDDMPLRAHHRRRLGAPRVALLGAVAGGILLAACAAANPPAAAPPDTTRPVPSLAPTSTAGARGAELGIFEVSCHTGKGVTASGRPSSRETVSVDPRVVPLGTRLVIDKVGTRVAADTGGAIKGRRLDIWEPSMAACTRFGRRQLRVWQAR